MKNKKHWDNWAKEYKNNLRATTMTTTIKRLELQALEYGFGFAHYKSDILEVGCGNGINLKYFVEKYPDTKFTGMDYSKEMLKNVYKHRNINYINDDILNPKHKGVYDIVFTDRCLINMPTIKKQIEAFNNISAYAKPTGIIVLIENIVNDLNNLNKLRNALDMEDKKVAPFNLFIDEDKFLKNALKKHYIIADKNFASLHDLILYVLNCNGKEVDYNAPIMKRTTDLLSKCPEVNYGNWGQNRLMVFSKRRRNEIL